MYDLEHLTLASQLVNRFLNMQVIDAQIDMPVVGAISLYVSLLTFTLRVHPDRLDYVDQVLVCSCQFGNQSYKPIWNFGGYNIETAVVIL